MSDLELIQEEIVFLRRDLRCVATLIIATQIPPLPGQPFMMAWANQMETAKILVDKAFKELYK